MSNETRYKIERWNISSKQELIPCVQYIYAYMRQLLRLERVKLSLQTKGKSTLVRSRKHKFWYLHNSSNNSWVVRSLNRSRRGRNWIWHFRFFFFSLFITGWWMLNNLTDLFGTNSSLDVINAQWKSHHEPTISYLKPPLLNLLRNFPP